MCEKYEMRGRRLVYPYSLVEEKLPRRCSVLVACLKPAYILVSLHNLAMSVPTQLDFSVVSAMVMDYQENSYIRFETFY